MWLVVHVLLILSLPLSASAEYLGELSANPYAPDSTANPYGAGSPFKPDGINNPYSPSGSLFSNQFSTNPFATDPPRLYDQQEHYRGKLSTNPYDADSTSNPFGRYGSPFSQDSINNPYGAGNPYNPNSPTNPYGRGLRIEENERGVLGKIKQRPPVLSSDISHVSCTSSIVSPISSFAGGNCLDSRETLHERRVTFFSCMSD